MKLHDLRQPVAKADRKRIGRGHGSGHGKSAGFGTKGQGARSGRGGSLYFEGGQLPLVRRLPHKRGFRNRNRVPYSVVNVGMLNIFPVGSMVEAIDLVAAGLVRDFKQPIKILGDGELERALTVRVEACSAAAKAKIEAAGGTFEAPEEWLGAE
ncbi:MAG: 50S ribosomal protein L15 [Chloroflexi bacterium]|nr:50S ribosomal protein L15 [Chloroflexota bacterium]